MPSASARQGGVQCGGTLLWRSRSGEGGGCDGCVYWSIAPIGVRDGRA